jgi:ferric-dicitrate binding protein FerR (iron transport regulator)
MKPAAAYLSLFGMALLIVSGNVAADDFRARIVKVQGDVVILNDKGEARKPEKSQFLVNKMETVVTRDGGKAVVQFDDGALSVMEEKSSIRVEQSGWFSQLGGKVYYVFRKVLGQKEQPRQVKTGFATIGIRGTTFIVYDTAEGKGVALQDGNLNIESPGEDYAITRPQQANDFEAFKQDMRQREEAMKREFKEYKEKTEREFVEYKKSFDLAPNRMVSFDGNKVTEVELNESFKDQFDQMQTFAGKYVKAYRELDMDTME